MRPRIHFDGNPDYLERIRNLYTGQEQESRMTVADLAYVVVVLCLGGLTAMGAESAFYKLRYWYRRARVRRLIRQESEYFKDYMETH